jgi:hypothetical protein
VIEDRLPTRLELAIAERERRRHTELVSIGWTGEVEWRVGDDGQMAAYASDGRRVPWAPLPGSQTIFMRSLITEVLFEGPRGNGKSDALLMDFAQYVGKGFGRHWRGILFRRKKTELDEVVERAKELFGMLFPDAVYNEVRKQWRFATGESIKFTHFDTIADYGGYQGHQYPWIGWEELTLWPSDDCYTRMFSNLRSPRFGIPLHVRAATNPYGVGHNWVRRRFQLPLLPGQHIGPTIIDIGKDGKALPARAAVHGSLIENRVLMHATPNYVANLVASTNDPNRQKAWIGGAWDVVAGGMFDDLWNPDVHVLPSFPVSAIPDGWRIDRAYDDGSAKPFSAGWYAESNGEPFMWEGRLIGPVAGDLVRFSELYGSTGQPNEGLRITSREIAKMIIAHEEELEAGGRVHPGPADSQIYAASSTDPSKTVASEMEEEHVSWSPASKGPGSRVQGWKAIRGMLKGALPGDEGRREAPGLFVTKACPNFLLIFPTLPRKEGNPDDIPTEVEDHIADELRYRARHVPGDEMSDLERFQAQAG